jgi:hypothetical protein
MICWNNTRIFFKILKIPQMLCESYTEESEKLRGGDCNIQKDVGLLRGGVNQ